MTRPRRTRALSLALLPVLALLAVVSAASPAHASAHYHQPSVGECHDYQITASQQVSEPSAPVDCASPHTAQVVAVLTLAHGLSLSRPTAASVRQIYSRCFRGIQRTLGGKATTQALTAYQFAFFAPTAAEQRHGARWIRCDLVLQGGRKLDDLPTPLLPHPLTDSVTKCLARKSPLLETSCDRRHVYRSEGAVQLHGPNRTNAEFLAIASRRCPGIAGKKWFATWPGRDAWPNGADKVLVCYRKTTR